MWDFTPGEWLYYGGITGAVVVVIAAIVVTIVLAGRWKRLRRKLDDEYGGSEH